MVKHDFKSLLLGKAEENQLVILREMSSMRPISIPAGLGGNGTVLILTNY